MSTVRNIRSNLKVVSPSGEDHFEEDFHERSEVIVGEHSDSFYLRPEEDDRVYSDPATVSHWMKCELILEELMKVGIHTHERYDEAMENFKQAWKAN